MGGQGLGGAQTPAERTPPQLPSLQEGAPMGQGKGTGLKKGDHPLFSPRAQQMALSWVLKAMLEELENPVT